jgi:cyclopropane-fatty-acyl-phospholipid synthase
MESYGLLIDRDMFYDKDHTLEPFSRVYWADRTDGEHRNFTEDWLQKYASEMLAMLPLGGTLLDVGCGACEVTTYLAPAFRQVYAVDFSESMLTAAQQRVDNQSMLNIQLLNGTAKAFPKEVINVDVVLSQGVAQYFSLEDLIHHLRECRRVLNVRGIVCVAEVPNRARQALYYRTRLAPKRSSGRASSLRREIDLIRKRAVARLKKDIFWDGIGNWFSLSDVEVAANDCGFDSEFLNSWYYDYRFHALLSRKEDVA